MMQSMLTRGTGLALALVLVVTAALSTAAAQEGQAMQSLRSLIPPDLKGTCERLRQRDMAVNVRGAVAALVCTPSGPIEDVGLYLFDDADELEG
jgi:pyrroline-5-carboxylate reductase